MTFKRLLRLLKASFQAWQKDKASRLAAALAYYTVFSLSPLLILAIAIAGAIFGEQAARGEIVGQIEGLVGQQGAQTIQTALENANQPNVGSVASIISIVVLLFGASGVFIQLQDAMNTIWNVAEKPDEGIKNLIRKRLLSFSMVLAIGFLLLVSLLISAILSGLSHYLSNLVPGFDFLWQILNLVISFGIVTVLFAFIYKYLPDVNIQWRDVWVGAAITAFLFTLGKWILGIYLGQGSFGSTYGAAGSLVVLLAWVYYSAQILFFGAEFTQVYAQRYGSKITPGRHAVHISE